MGSHLLRTYSVRSLRRSAYLRGAASAFDLRGNTLRQYRIAADPALVDYEAVAGDWKAVGDDLRGAMRSHVPQAS